MAGHEDCRRSGGGGQGVGGGEMGGFGRGGELLGEGPARERQ